jgi:hypothetical protein
MLATKRYEAFFMTGITTHAQKTVDAFILRLLELCVNHLVKNVPLLAASG